MRDLLSDHQELPSTRSYRSRMCSAPGCSVFTREGKPYCPTHVEFNAYVQEVIRVRDLRDAEMKGILSGRRVAEDSQLAEEILSYITHHGPKTVKRLARDLLMDVRVIKKLVRALKRKGLIQTSVTTRGSVIVRLV